MYSPPSEVGSLPLEVRETIHRLSSTTKSLNRDHQIQNKKKRTESSGAPDPVGPPNRTGSPNLTRPLDPLNPPRGRNPERLIDPPTPPRPISPIRFFSDGNPGTLNRTEN
ncbi:hypothetical protein O0L34_g3644 [Tuta absoluta]|nr:hypothetical protein O0L34_g3644 [Tuta absoluta]